MTANAFDKIVSSVLPTPPPLIHDRYMYSLDGRTDKILKLTILNHSLSKIQNIVHTNRIKYVLYSETTFFGNLPLFLLSV